MSETPLTDELFHQLGDASAGWVAWAHDLEIALAAEKARADRAERRMAAAQRIVIEQNAELAALKGTCGECCHTDESCACPDHFKDRHGKVCWQKRPDIFPACNAIKRKGEPVEEFPCGHDKVHPEDEICRWCSP